MECEIPTGAQLLHDARIDPAAKARSIRNELCIIRAEMQILEDAEALSRLRREAVRHEADEHTVLGRLRRAADGRPVTPPNYLPPDVYAEGWKPIWGVSADQDAENVRRISARSALEKQLGYEAEKREVSESAVTREANAARRELREAMEEETALCGSSSPPPVLQEENICEGERGTSDMGGDACETCEEAICEGGSEKHVTDGADVQYGEGVECDGAVEAVGGNPGVVETDVCVDGVSIDHSLVNGESSMETLMEQNRGMISELRQEVVDLERLQVESRRRKEELRLAALLREEAAAHARLLYERRVTGEDPSDRLSMLLEEQRQFLGADGQGRPTAMSAVGECGEKGDGNSDVGNSLLGQMLQSQRAELDALSRVLSGPSGLAEVHRSQMEAERAAERRKEIEMTMRENRVSREVCQLSHQRSRQREELKSMKADLEILLSSQEDDRDEK